MCETDYLLEIPSPELVFAIVQVARGHRRTDLFDEEEYPSILQIDEENAVHMPYLAALVRLADEIDVTKARNPMLLYDLESLTDDYQIHCNRLLLAVPSMEILPDAFILNVQIDDEESGQSLRDDVIKTAGKMQNSLDICRSVTEEKTPFRISQKYIKLNFL